MVDCVNVVESSSGQQYRRVSVYPLLLPVSVPVLLGYCHPMCPVTSQNGARYLREYFL